MDNLALLHRNESESTQLVETNDKTPDVQLKSRIV